MRDNFSDYEEYRSTWEPLFQNECYYQFINMKFEDKKLKMSEMSWTASIHFLSESKPFTNLLMTLPRNLLIIVRFLNLNVIYLLIGW